MVSFLSTRKTMRSAWVLDNGASFHMKKEQELFSIMIERDSKVHVELGDDANYVVKGERTITFQLESRGSFDAYDVIYVPSLKKNFISVLPMEDRGFVAFKEGMYSYVQRKLSQTM
jgi:hypothetical protein